jgi:hypothetical protein
MEKPKPLQLAFRPRTEPMTYFSNPKQEVLTIPLLCLMIIEHQLWDRYKNRPDDSKKRNWFRK